MGYWGKRVKSGGRAAVGAARPLVGDRSGTTLIEFAAIAAPLFGLLVAILQISLVYFAQELLETAEEKAVRQLLTGAAQQGNMTQSGFKALMCSYLPNFMQGASGTCANLYVQVSSAGSWSAVTTTRPTITYDSQGNVSNSFSYTPGGSHAINVVQAMYVWNVETGPLSFDMSNMSNNRRLLYATSVIQTEPY